VGSKKNTDAIFEDLNGSIKRNPKRDIIWTPWISKETWALVDKKAALKQSTRSSPREDKRLKRKIHIGIRIDRKKRTKDVRQSIKVLLGQHNLRGVWRTLKTRYLHASGRTTKPPKIDLTELQTEYGVLFANQPSTGYPIPVLVSPFYVNDMTPTDKEIGAAVRGLHSRNSPGPSGMRPDDLKEWWDTAWRDKDPDTTEWEKLVELVQHIFETGNLPLELKWSLLVAITKGSGGFRAIGLLEITWKLISSIIDSRLKQKIILHPALHGFRAFRGTGTASIDLKVRIQLATIHQRPIYAIMLDLNKAYDSLHRDRTLEILRSYSMGPNLIRLVSNYWEPQMMVIRQGGYYSGEFHVARGVTQGDIPSPEIFNIVVDALKILDFGDFRRRESGDSRRSMMVRCVISILCR
jgi:hypothetical protein